MSFTLRVDGKQLKLAAQRMQGSVQDRALLYTALKAHGEILQVAVNNHLLAIYSNLPAQVHTEGTAFVKADIFSSVIKELPDGMIELETDASFLIVRGGKTSAFEMKIPLVETGIWREPELFTSVESLDISTSKLNYFLTQVFSAVQLDSERNYTTVGFLHSSKPNTLRIVGSDSFRLVYSELQLPGAENFMTQGLTLGKRTLQEVLNMASEGFETIKLSVVRSHNCLVCEAPGYKIYLRLSAVTYPNYVSKLPHWEEGHTKEVTLNRLDLQTMIRRVLLASDKNRILGLHFFNDTLTVFSKTQGASEGRESIPLTTCSANMTGLNTTITLHGKSFSDALSTILSDQVVIQFKSPSEEFIISPFQEPNDIKSKHFLIPIEQHN